MGPNFTGMQKVFDRIDEIVRRCQPPMERQSSVSSVDSVKDRFVNLLDAQEKINKQKKIGTDKVKASAGSVSIDDLRRTVSSVAEEYNLDEELVRAVIQVESGWKPDAVSSKGAMGLMQLMPPTAAMLGVDDAFDPEQNISGGVKYLAQLTDKYDGDVEMALAAYNAGPGKVDAAGGKIPFSSTERYVKNVMALYHRYREES